MSRSVRQTPIVRNAGSSSEKQDKVAANGKLRAAVRVALKREDDIIPDIREVSDPWTFTKDGKHWWPDDDRRK